MSRPAELHLAIALDGAGWHPAAWRASDARPTSLFTAGYWTDVVLEAERGRVDFVTIEDSLGLQSEVPDGPDGRTDRVRGRLDAVLVASRVAPRTTWIGLVPTAVVTHTEPFHLSKSIATLDYVSTGRAGVRVQISPRQSDAALFGRRELAPFDLRRAADSPVLTDLFDEAGDYVEVVRRLWDSWEDDAEIRDAATGRFVDREKLHYIDFRGRWFDVRGPSITPRPPQGQPLVTALAHSTLPYRFAARHCDVVFVTPRDEADAEVIVGQVRGEQAAAGRADDTVHIFGDLEVYLDSGPDAAAARKSRLDELAGSEPRSDAAVFVGTPAELSEQLIRWARAGLTGFRLRPGAIPHDLLAITRGLVPRLQDEGVFRTDYSTRTLRRSLGLTRPANRFGMQEAR